MKNRTDIALLKMPNHNVDYPSISIPTLTRALRSANHTVHQDDLNVRLRDDLFTAKNLEHLTFSFLPDAGMNLFNDHDEYHRIKKILSFLVQLKSTAGFHKLEQIKERMLNREYEELFQNPDTAHLCSIVFVIESIFHNIVDISIKCDALALSLDSENIVVNYLKNKAHEIVELNPRMVGFSILDIQRTVTMWFAQYLHQFYSGLILVGGPDVEVASVLRTTERRF